MPKRIEQDHQDFRDIYSGRIRKELQKYIKNGQIFRARGKNGKIAITIPRIEDPRIVYGNNNQGVGRGPGKEGDVIDKDDKGKGKGGRKPGEGHSDGVPINIDMEEIFKFLQDELKLPDLKPKTSQTFEEVEIKYNDIALQGPESLRHNRRTILQAMRRMASSGTLDNLVKPPGYAQPIRIIQPINTDRRYRQYKEIKKPASNAVIFFARDGSGSMDQYKCDIVSDMAWWIDLYIRRYYKRTESRYIWHDTEAEEVDQKKFYRYRYGGGTTCSSAFRKIASLCTKKEHQFPPDKWNIYVFYFTDGENYGEDNKVLNELIKKKFGPNVVNMIGITQVCSWAYQNSLKEAVDKFDHASNVRTTSIGPEVAPDMSAKAAGYYYGQPALTDEQRDEQIKKAIVDLLGVNNAKDVKATKKSETKVA